MEPKFIFRFKMNKELFAQMVKINLSRTKVKRQILALAVCVLVLGLIGGLLVDPFFFALLVICVPLALYYAFFEKIAVKNTLKINGPLVDCENETVFTEEEIRQRFDAETVRQEYSVFIEIMETEDYFCLCEAAAKMILIPKNSIVQGEITQFKSFIEEKLCRNEGAKCLKY